MKPIELEKEIPKGRNEAETHKYRKIANGAIRIQKKDNHVRRRDDYKAECSPYETNPFKMWYNHR